ncbi:hypothetical protein [Bdellovibrio sp.]|uniref:hypothetical protein n=1 Tax=Bdellovibrio sp. TaxID=28201 RepID=UPI0039E69C31
MNLVFQYEPQIDVFRRAQLEDVERCLTRDEYDEVVWVSHGVLADGISQYSAPILVQDNGRKIVLTKRYFESLSSRLNNGQLKKFRLSVCGLNYGKDFYNSHQSGELFSSVDILLHALSKQGVKIDLSKRSTLGSWLYKKEVTSLARYWLEESLPPDRQMIYP